MTPEQQSKIIELVSEIDFCAFALGAKPCAETLREKNAAWETLHTFLNDGVDGLLESETVFHKNVPSYYQNFHKGIG